MNKIFKSIWNHVTRTFTAVSEIQQTNGKKAKSALTKAVIASSLTMMAGASQAYSKDEDIWPENPNKILPFSIGINSPYLRDDSSYFRGNNTFRLPTVQAEINTDTLFSLSSQTYE